MNSKSNAELLPCPFCGARLQRQETSSGHWYEHKGEVEDCYATGSIVFDENIEAWNRRPSRLEAISEAEPVGEAGTMPGTTGFTMAAFEASKVPVGTKLYTAHTPPAGHVVVPVEAASSDFVRLDDCPPGLFLFNDTLCFRSEYSTATPTNPAQPDAYVVETGEYFWGGCTTSIDRNDLLVRPVAALPHNQGGAK